MHRFGLVALLILMSVTSSTLGQQRVFIGVGVEKYDDTNITPTPYCVNDVKLIAKLLSDKERGTFQRVILLHSDQRDELDQPTKTNIERELQSNLRNLKKTDTVVFFFAGHGYRNSKGQGFLIPKDTELNNFETTAIATSTIRKLLARTEATKVMILDCCHAGARGVAIRPKLKPASGVELGKEFAEIKNVLTIASCDEDQKSYSYQSVKHGLFTYMLAQALTNDDLDQNQDGLLEAAELYVFVRDKVKATAKTLVQKKQIPAFKALGKLPDVTFTKAVNTTVPFTVALNKEQGGLPPKGWRGTMVVFNGVLVPKAMRQGNYAVELPSQKIRKNFYLQMQVRNITTPFFGGRKFGFARKNGGVSISLRGKKGVPFVISLVGGVVYVNKQAVGQVRQESMGPTNMLTLKRVVTKRGSTIVLEFDNQAIYAGKIDSGPLEQVHVGVTVTQYDLNWRRPPQIQTVNIGPLQNTQ
ncbi:MAG: caspase domain-containing protein [Gemmataceae bacterium]